jgi:hypothetical protein
MFKGYLLHGNLGCKISRPACHVAYAENDIIAFIAVVPEGLYISIYQKPFNKCKITIPLIRLIGVIMHTKVKTN